MDRDDPRALRFVSVSGTLPRHEVRLVDESGRNVPDRTVGRLIFRGPSMMTGYHRKPEESAAITVDEGWLDSGDLAYRADEEIFIAERLKDLIIKGVAISCRRRSSGWPRPWSAFDGGCHRLWGRPASGERIFHGREGISSTGDGQSGNDGLGGAPLPPLALRA